MKENIEGAKIRKAEERKRPLSKAEGSRCNAESESTLTPWRKILVIMKIMKISSGRNSEADDEERRREGKSILEENAEEAVMGRKVESAERV